MRIRPRTRGRHAEEDGYVLVGLLFVVALLLISLTVAMPRVREDIQRDQELETMHRGQQYSRAIQLYYRHFRSYPASVDALVNTNELRFLRRKYADPMTGKDDWQPIAPGTNKAPILFGFFGQPYGVAGASVTGLGAAVGSNSNGAASSGANGQSNSQNGGGSLFGSSAGPNSGQPTGPTFGGAGIMGFSPASAKPSIMVYKTMTHYDEWEFVYSPLADWSMRGFVPAAPAVPPVNAGSPGFNPGAPGKK
jgi:type II secretory pathway pseudopilin PulG